MKLCDKLLKAFCPALNLSGTMLTSAGPTELLLLFTLFHEKQRASEKTELCSNSPTERSLGYSTIRERDRRIKEGFDR